MKKGFCSSLILTLLAACGEKSGPPPTPDAATADSEAWRRGVALEETGEDTEDQAAVGTVSGEMTMRLFDSSSPGEAARKPTFKVSSPKFSLLREGVWTFEKATGIIYAREGRTLTIEAQEGILDKNANRASLTGGVTFETGPFQVSLTDIAWSNEDRTVRSDQPLTITGADTQLEAASIEFAPDTEALSLTGVKGVLRLAESVAAAADGRPRLQQAEITQPARRVELLAGKLQRMLDGQIRLAVEDSGAKSLLLSAGTFQFVWDATGGSPAAIVLKNKVRVDSEQEGFTCDEARLDLPRQELLLAGRVAGRSPKIGAFACDRVRYSLVSEDSEMANLRAKNVALGGGTGPDQYAGLDVDRALHVRFKAGRVQRMTGGVAITLHPKDPTEKNLQLQADEAEFDWPENPDVGPSGITLRRRVSVDGPEGLIRSERAEIATGSKRVVFSGNVSGRAADIPQFQADQLTYDMGSRDSKMTNLTAKDMPLRGFAGTVDIEKAPSVLIQQGALNAIQGGVRIVLTPADAKQELKAQADRVTFDYAQEAEPALSAVNLHGGVRVSSPQIAVDAEAATLTPAENQVVFAGNVKASRSGGQEFRGERLTYRLDTGDFVMDRFRSTGVTLVETSHRAATPPTISGGR